MKLVVDNSLPFIKGVFEPYADVVYKEGPEICHQDMVDAVGLILRSRTICNESTLSGTNVKIIATATAGLSNIDTSYCDSHGIFVNNANGCNAGAVSNYVFSALLGAASRRSIVLKDKKLGIIGMGNTGQRVETIGRSLGLKILRNDPYREQIEWYTQFTCLDELLAESDIVSLHIPLTNETNNIANKEFFSKMKEGAFFINTSHGNLVVEEDLIEAAPRLGPIIIDAWRNEPMVNLNLIDICDVATPHIAGYSLQSKQIGSAMAVRSIARFFKLEKLYDFFPKVESIEYQAVRLDILGKSQGQITSMVQYNYPVFTDDFFFRTNPTRFVELRKDYHYRREFFL